MSSSSPCQDECTVSQPTLQKRRPAKHANVHTSLDTVAKRTASTQVVMLPR